MIKIEIKPTIIIQIISTKHSLMYSMIIQLMIIGLRTYHIRDIRGVDHHPQKNKIKIGLLLSKVMDLDLIHFNHKSIHSIKVDYSKVIAV